MESEFSSETPKYTASYCVFCIVGTEFLNIIYMDFFWLQRVKHRETFPFTGSTIKRQTVIKRGHLLEVITSLLEARLRPSVR
jgi:hypothetical protein